MAKNQALFNILYKIYTSRGASAIVANMAAAQDMYESAHGESNVAKNNTNYGGIKFANQPGAVPGLLSSEGNRYAKFKNIAAFADAKIKILKRAPGKPWMARNIQQFVDGLVKNRYFTDSPDRYAKNLIAVYNMYTTVPAGVYTRPRTENKIFAPPSATNEAELRAQADEDVRTGIIEQQKREHEAQRKADGTVPFFEDLFDGDGITILSKKNKQGLVVASVCVLGAIMLINLTRR